MPNSKMEIIIVAHHVKKLANASLKYVCLNAKEALTIPIIKSKTYVDSSKIGKINVYFGYLYCLNRIIAIILNINTLAYNKKAIRCHRKKELCAFTANSIKPIIA